MEEKEILQTQTASETAAPTESAEETAVPTEETALPLSDMPLEEIHVRYEKKSGKKESFGDILVTQITLSIILLLGFALMNIIKPDFVREAVVYFRDMSRGEPEEFFKSAVREVMKIIRPSSFV